MTARAKDLQFLLALREARRRAGEFLAARVGLSIERAWFIDLGPTLLLTFQVHERLSASLGGRLPITVRHALATSLDQRLAALRPLVRISEDPRRRPGRVRRRVD